MPNSFAAFAAMSKPAEKAGLLNVDKKTIKSSGTTAFNRVLLMRTSVSVLDDEWKKDSGPMGFLMRPGLSNWTLRVERWTLRRVSA
jgi:hypothetical protein